MFLNRKTELKELENLWKQKKGQLLVLYGRRRVGKSALLRHWSAGKNSFYWTATQTTSGRLLQSISQGFHLFKHPGSSVSDDFSHPNWESFLLDVATYASQKKILFVLDEFPYAIEAEPELPSLFQKMWDHHLKTTGSFFCLTGSRIGMVEKHILSSQGALYGRATAVMWLDPLELSSIREFFPGYSPSQLVELYAVTGGIPLYLEIFDGTISVMANLKRELFSRTSLLKTEAYFLVHEELKEPMRYVAILEAMGRGGKCTQSELSRATGIIGPHIIPYLHVLERLKYIKKFVPVTEDPRKSRKGRYRITDFFLKFYYRFIGSHVQLMEEGREQKIMDEISSQWESFIGKNGFEEICRLWLARQAKKSTLPFDPDVIGSYWDTEMEIDLAAFSKKHRSIIIGEAKWTQKKCELPVLDDLNKKAQALAKKTGFHVGKMIFSRSGFSSALRERARIEQVSLVDLKELFLE